MIDEEVSTINQLYNPFGEYVRHHIGDENLNKILDADEFDSSEYVKKISKIVHALKENVSDTKKVDRLLQEYFAYVVECIGLNVDKGEFSNLITSNLDQVELFDELEKENIIRHLDRFSRKS